MTSAEPIPASSISAVGGVALGVADVAFVTDFYERVWGLEVIARQGERVYLKGAGRDGWLLSLEPAPQTCIIHADLMSTTAAATEALEARLAAHGIDHGWVDCAGEPQGGRALCFSDPWGRHWRIRDNAALCPPAPAPDRPIKITHLVLNSDDAARDVAWYEAVLGLRVIDETGIMFFLNAGQADHHTIAIAKSDNLALNHIAFEMPSLDAVMRGAGRMRDAGYPIGWGVGRHGPGANVFAYFVGPAGEVIEYTGDIEQIDARYRVGRPADWQWPPGRNDRWGVGIGPTDTLKAAQRRTFFADHVGETP